MALTKQNTPTSSRVSVDFPVMPRLPQMKIPEDHASMQAHQVELDKWYQAFRQATLDKLQAVQDQINSLKKG